MTIDVRHRAGISVLKPSGQLSGGPDSALTQAVMPLIEQRGSRVVLDLSAVEYISSGGLGDLVRLTAQANSQGARIVLAQPSPFVAGVLNTTRLDRFFDLAPDVEVAIQKLGGTAC
jgi:anti-anti-sigma factor